MIIFFYSLFVFGFHLFLTVYLKTAKSALFGKNIPFYTLMTAYGKMWHNAVIPINKGKVEILPLLHQLHLCHYKFLIFFIMAKLNGLIKFEGTLDNLTFYKSADGHFVRTKGGVSKNRIMNDPAFVRTRENGMEFGSIAGSGKLLRNSLGSFVFKAKDAKLSSRLVKVMGQIKNLDSESIRGERNVAMGLTDAAAKLLLKGFDFNAKATLGSVLNSSISVDVATGTVTIAPFNPMEQLRAADGATHFSLQVGYLNLDFATGESDLTVSPEEIYPLVQGVITPVLTPNAVPNGNGVGMHVLLIEFFQEVNGVQYLLNNGAYNVLNLLEVQ